ncbi:class I SAM-dependent methyltransferase [Streptomyces sp. DSM 44915]|uniref:Class I SAM-dependent methyltransferase n=1 Tax=Streptomyces chisholmiae TaxID=3075540 RepID=A0ABU2JQ25_9ACTN|nr:class I SAM-dependent methyltransferase [Streptomyces sp. DSM 44915]MDT0266826.1 class I SAM-dependent methyltransferase [Streptomyces sp. DSM 44915]
MTRPRVTRAEWDTQYRAGRWDYLGGRGESVRYDHLAAFAGRTGAGSVLDIGCGAGVLREVLGGDGYQGGYLGVDWSLQALPPQPSPARHRFLCADVGRLPLAVPAFDLIVAGEVLYYLDDPAAALARARRLLLPGGTLVASCYQPRADQGSRWLPAVARLDALLATATGGAGPVRLTEPTNGRRWHVYHVPAVPSPS